MAISFVVVRRDPPRGDRSESVGPRVTPHVCRVVQTHAEHRAPHYASSTRVSLAARGTRGHGRASGTGDKHRGVRDLSFETPRGVFRTSRRGVAGGVFAAAVRGRVRTNPRGDAKFPRNSSTHAGKKRLAIETLVRFTLGVRTVFNHGVRDGAVRYPTTRRDKRKHKHKRQTPKETTPGSRSWR